MTAEIAAARRKNRRQLEKADRLGKEGKDEEAERIWRRYLEKCPQDPVILFNVGVVLKKRSNSPALRHEAGEFFARVIESPAADLEHKADSLNNLGILALKAGADDKALTCFSFVLKMQPDHPAALANYGDCLRCAGDFAAANDCYTKLALANPDSAEAHYSSGFIALLMGDYERGWKEYHWRHKLQSWQTKPIVSTRPRYNGEPLDGKIIIFCEEQGFGDSLMGIRFARAFSKRGAKVLWGAQERIREVMRHVHGVSDVVPRDDTAEFDYHLSLLDAPMWLGTTLKTIPQAHCLEIGDEWPKWIPPQGGRKPRVALVWAGSPMHGRDHARSIKAEQFQPIIDAHPEIDFYSLQVGPRAPEVALLSGLTADLAPTIRTGANSWTDTAQVLKWVDLLVSVDTACIHMAGCVNTEAWMLTPASPDWRWGLGSDKTEWYPKLTLFRQPKKEDWNTPLERINERLFTRFKT